MTRLILAAAAAVALATPAFAQIVENPGAPVVPAPALGEAPGQVTGPANSGPGSIVVIPRGNGAGTAASDSAAAGNAEQQNRPVPQVGGGGGGGGQ